ncbi:shikimate dehydrogenase [Streptomyces hainanensis]|uniref:Shikimate dehydrogenase n=1 Tax=Streptomyces hainanensis TaxID=402648 RepID=A0A4R4TRE7_9ACTN|nr:shikimate dehydrogenase [Streptomyces hainanensis]TDC79336.1 shikimate dehydrogenase [Streptomyces hainanensis]
MSPRPAAHRAAVLGSPIAHSLSPVLHRAGYAARGLDDWDYGRFEVDEAGLADFLGGLGPEWAGLSLTMPLKRAVIPLLDELTPTATTVEAVNTVVFTPDGRRAGHNTDVPGLVAALRERGVTRVEHATVLGAGATASSALAALAEVCSGDVTAYVRSPERAAEMRALGARLGLPVAVADWAEAHRGLTAPLVIATTPAGTADALAEAVPAAPGTLFDVLYEPWPTPLAVSWSARGGHVLGGLDLLVHQAVLQFELMTGETPGPLKEMRAAGETALDGEVP